MAAKGAFFSWSGDRKFGMGAGVRMIGLMRTTLAVAGFCVVAGLFAPSAFGAPSLGVEVTRDQLSVNRGDEFASYEVRVKNTANPNPATGTVLSCQTGTWTPSSGSLIPALTFQWLRDGVAIAGATSATYALAAADQGHAVQCQVTATNSAAASTAVAAPVVAAPAPAVAPPAPTAPLAASARPTVSGTGAVVGTSTRTCAVPASWSGSPTYGFQWLRNGVAIVDAADATTATHTIVANDVNKILQCRVIGSNAGGAAAGISLNNIVGAVANPPANAGAVVNPSVSSPDVLSGTTSLSVAFPAGLRLSGGSGAGWVCQVVASTCTTTSALLPGGEFPVLSVEAFVYPELAADAVSVTFSAYGGGAPNPAVAQDSFILGPAIEFGFTSFTAQALDGLGVEYAVAGGHPFRGTATFKVRTRKSAINGDIPAEDLRDVVTDLPAGFLGNVTSVPAACTVAQVKNAFCPAASAVGVARVRLDTPTSGASASPLYRVVPDRGYAAAFAFSPHEVSKLTVVLRAKLRADGDYGVTVVAPLVPQSPLLFEATDVSLCSYGAQLNDVVPGERAVFLGCKQPGDPGAKAVPFLTNPTECAAEPPVTRAHIDSWQNPGALNSEGFPDLTDSNWKSYQAVAPLVTGCDQVPFDPAVDIAPTSTAAGGASGLHVDFDVPQDGLLDPDGIATSHLKKTVVELPAGLSANPSSAAGLEGCTDEQIAVRSSRPPACPDGSTLGTVDVTSPLIAAPLTGEMYLGAPKSTDPTSGEMLRLFLSVRNDELGLTAKVAGSATADPDTGRLTATFDDNPRVPFDRLEVDLKDGDRGVLANPQDCATITATTTLTPWSGTGPIDRDSTSDINSDCAERFAPKLEAGNSDNQARNQGGTYSFKFTRQDGDQWLRGLTATLPKGLLASVKDVPLCANSQADAGACPAASKIGIVDAKAGAGDPFVLEQKGEMFLTQGYKGGQYGLAVKVRPIAGPFRDDMELSPINVRQAIHVDRTTAQVTAISDPFPVIHHGIPLRVREINVLVNRTGFMLNPSNCTQKQTGAALLSTENATANLTDPFQVTGCPNLAFKPKLALALTGRKQTTTGKHPGIRAQVTQQGTSEAGIEKAVVRLPKSLALDVNNADALCEFADGTKPDLENHCPKGSIVGRARAKTPLLKDDLAGNVYFVKNIRKDPVTGNEIRTLPMIVVALRGEIAVNLKGESNTTKAGKLVNTFNNVPDAPISQFNLNIKGGKTGIIAVTRTRRSLINICAGRHTAEADMDGHNGRRHDRDIHMKTPCTKKQTKAAKRKAKRAARRR
jgi:hypothetical protein